MKCGRTLRFLHRQRLKDLSTCVMAAGAASLMARHMRAVHVGHWPAQQLLQASPAARVIIMQVQQLLLPELVVSLLCQRL